MQVAASPPQDPSDFYDRPWDPFMTSQYLTHCPASMDHIQTTLRNAAHGWRIASLDRFDMDVVIAQAEESSPVIDQDGTQIGFDRYRFFSWGQPDKVLRVRRQPDAEVLVYIEDEWLSVPSALESFNWPLPGDQPSISKDFRILRQQQWWVENGKIFTFLKLPAEIRNNIYQFVFGFHVVPSLPDWKFGRYRQRTNFQADRSISILHVNRRIHKEAKYILYTSAVFTTQHLVVARRILAQRFPRDNIRRLELRLPHEDWFHLFGSKPTESGEIRKPATCAWALRSMGLDSMELYIACPSSKSKDSRGWLEKEDACQKIAVDWIFEAVWPIVHGLPITISGYVKKRQRLAFEAACEVERDNFKLWREARKAAGDSGKRYLVDWDEESRKIGEAEATRIAEQPQDLDEVWVTTETQHLEDTRGDIQSVGTEGQKYERDINSKLAERLTSYGVDVWKPGSSVIVRETPRCVHKRCCGLHRWSEDE